jgi:hypothetical protein
VPDRCQYLFGHLADQRLGRRRGIGTHAGHRHRDDDDRDDRPRADGVPNRGRESSPVKVHRHLSSDE